MDAFHRLVHAQTSAFPPFSGHPPGNRGAQGFFSETAPSSRRVVFHKRHRGEERAKKKLKNGRKFVWLDGRKLTGNVC